MTFCLALSIRDFSLVAADTRVNMVVNGEVVVHDGPEDLDVSVASPQYSLNVPFRQRKLARVQRGWVTMAGHYLLARELISQATNGSSDMYEALAPTFRENLAEATARIHETTALPLEDFNDTVVFGAPFEGDRVWVFSCNAEKVRSTSDAGNYVINWPNDYDTHQRVEEQNRFLGEFEQAQQSGSLPGIFRAVARLVKASASGSTQSGPYCQIGVSFRSSTEQLDSVYFQSHCEELLRMPGSSVLFALDRNA
jgi:hypothetical protein